MIFKSRQVNLDPEPWQWSTRPEWRTSDPTRVIKTAGVWVWAPRREQFDTPVNRILVDVRAEQVGETDFGLYYARWEQSISDPAALGYWSADEIEHARKVLTRLAAI